MRTIQRKNKNASAAERGEERKKEGGNEKCSSKLRSRIVGQENKRAGERANRQIWEARARARPESDVSKPPLCSTIRVVTYIYFARVRSLVPSLVRSLAHYAASNSSSRHLGAYNRGTYTQAHFPSLHDTRELPRTTPTHVKSARVRNTTKKKGKEKHGRTVYRRVCAPR